MTDAVALRDATRSAEYYAGYMAEKKASIEHALGLRAPNLFKSISDRCFQIATASYSAGLDTAEVRHWFGECVTYQLRFIAEAFKNQAIGIGTIDDYAEKLAVAALLGRQQEFVTALHGRTYSEKPDPIQASLIEQLCAVLTQNAKFNYQELPAAPRQPKGWLLLPPLFKAVHELSHADFARCLEDYLAKSWGPAEEKLAKMDAKDPTPRYCGKWCFLAIALCREMGAIPPLSKKAAPYVPVDLFQPRS
jgi:hypothetical protein